MRLPLLAPMGTRSVSTKNAGCAGRSNAGNLLNIRGLPECNPKLDLIKYEDYYNMIANFTQQVVLAEPDRPRAGVRSRPLTDVCRAAWHFCRGSTHSCKVGRLALASLRK